MFCLSTYPGLRAVLPGLVHTLRTKELAVLSGFDEFLTLVSLLGEMARQLLVYGSLPQLFSFLGNMGYMSVKDELPQVAWSFKG